MRYRSNNWPEHIFENKLFCGWHTTAVYEVHVVDQSFIIFDVNELV